MKKIALLLSLAAMAVGCKNLADNEFEINGTVDPLWEGRTVVLEKQSMFGFKALDTVKVKNAEFTFKDTVTEPGIYFLRVEQHLNEPITVIVEPGSIDILVRRDSINKSRPGGTYNNDKFTEFSDVFGKGLKKVQRYEANNQAKFTKAMQANDTKTATELRDGRQKLMDSWSKDMVNFVKDNPKAYVGLLAISQMQQMQLKDQAELKKLYLGLDKSVREGKDGRQLGIYLGAVATGEPKQAPAAAPAAGVKVGDVAPSFSAKNPEGKEISLKESLGAKVTIIDFWASWCPPCRKENPNMVALYKKFHDKGLNIIGVSLDKTADKWKEAIQKDGLPWAQVSNLMYWDEPIAKQYGVEQIPAPFVLDAAGKVVARDIYGDELEKKVAELVK